MKPFDLLNKFEEGLKNTVDDYYPMFKTFLYYVVVSLILVFCISSLTIYGYDYLMSQYNHEKLIKVNALLVQAIQNLKDIDDIQKQKLLSILGDPHYQAIIRTEITSYYYDKLDIYVNLQLKALQSSLRIDMLQELLDADVSIIRKYTGIFLGAVGAVVIGQGLFIILNRYLGIK